MLLMAAPQSQGPPELASPLCVKNTFIDVEDAPPAPQSLRRATTSPPAIGGLRKEAGEEDEDLRSTEDGQSSHGEEEPELCRMNTRESWDHCDQWIVYSPCAAPPQPLIGCGATVGGGCPALMPSPTVAPGTGPFGGAASEASGARVQPQTVQQNYDSHTGCHLVQWYVDGKKLQTQNKQAVSPPFTLFDGGQSLMFKMMIHPEVNGEGKKNFKTAQGRGKIQLKCESDLTGPGARARFRISIGAGEQAQLPRGPVTHDFSTISVFGLPPEYEVWDFGPAVERQSMTFAVSLEIAFF